MTKLYEKNQRNETKLYHSSFEHLLKVSIWQLLLVNPLISFSVILIYFLSTYIFNFYSVAQNAPASDKLPVLHGPAIPVTEQPKSVKETCKQDNCGL
jgi:hypothetical protein